MRRAEVEFAIVDFTTVELPDEAEPGVHVKALTFRRLENGAPAGTL